MTPWIMLAACTTTGQPTLERPLSEGDRIAAEQLGADLITDDPPGVVCSTHAPWLTHLVATTDDPAIAAAAMRGLAGCGEQWHEPDVRTAVDRWWGARGIGVAGGLVAIAEPLAADHGPDDPAVEGLVRLAASHPETSVRLAALELLDRRAWGREPEVAGAFVDALLAVHKPVLTGTVLHWLRFEAPEVRFDVRPRLQAAATLALRDIDPGVRGRAARALGRLAGDDEAIVEQIRERLLDPHPFTRAAAATALADIGQERFVHDLVPMLQDHEATTWHSRAFVRLDGSSDRLRFVGSPHERVDEAVLLAVQRLTADLSQPYVIRDIDPDYADLDILSATREARAWYQAAYGATEAAPPAEEEGG